MLICVSRIAAEKNLDLACKLFQERIEQGKAKAGVIVGDGPERERLSREYPQLIFPGCLSKADLAEHYASADIFVFTSTTETFGNVVTKPSPRVYLWWLMIMQHQLNISNQVETGISTLGNEDSLSSNLDKIAFIRTKSTGGQMTKPADWKKIIGRFHRDLVEAMRIAQL